MLKAERDPVGNRHQLSLSTPGKAPVAMLALSTCEGQAPNKDYLLMVLFIYVSMYINTSLWSVSLCPGLYLCGRNPAGSLQTLLHPSYPSLMEEETGHQESIAA